MESGLFVQVRLGSSRLPGKALLPLAGATVIQHVMRALRAVPSDVYALLTDEKSLAELRGVASAEGFDAMAGPAEDVLARYCMAVRSYGVEEVIRATGDNPLTSARLARDILAIHRRSGSDLSHYLEVPWGSGVEVIRARALLEAERDAAQPDEREHITTFHYRHRDRFHIVEEPAPEYARCRDLRVTVDTAEDLEDVRRIFLELHRGVPVEIEQVIAWWKRRGGMPGG